MAPETHKIKLPEKKNLFFIRIHSIRREKSGATRSPLRCGELLFKLGIVLRCRHGIMSQTLLRPSGVGIFRTYPLGPVKPALTFSRRQYILGIIEDLTTLLLGTVKKMKRLFEAYYYGFGFAFFYEGTTADGFAEPLHI